MSNAMITKNIKSFRPYLIQVITKIEKYNNRQLNLFVNSFIGYTPKSFLKIDKPLKTYEDALDYINKSDKLSSEMIYITSQFNTQYDLVKELIITLDSSDSEYFQIPSNELDLILKVIEFFKYAD